MTRALVPVAALLLIAAPLFAQQEVKLPPGMKLHRIQCGTPGKDGWYAARPTEGHFSLALPVPFNDYTSRITEADGKVTMVYGVGSISSERLKFSATEVVRVRTTGKTDEETLAGFATSLMRPGTTLSGERRLKVAGHPAAQLHLDNPETKSDLRFILFPDRAFLLMVEYPSGQQELASQIVPRVMESFTFHDIESAKRPVKRPMSGNRKKG